MSNLNDAELPIIKFIITMSSSYTSRRVTVVKQR